MAIFRLTDCMCSLFSPFRCPNHFFSNACRNSSSLSGLDFEIQVMKVLSEYRMILERVGGSDDEGVDLCGIWELSPMKSIKVVVQCKSSSKRLGPKYIREFGGTTSVVVPSLAHLSIFATSSGFTPSSIK